MFVDLLKTIFNESKNERERQRETETDRQRETDRERQSVNESESESVNENKNESENENESDDWQYYLKQLNNNFKEINKTKSFKDQIDILTKYQTLVITGMCSIMKIINRQVLHYLN